MIKVSRSRLTYIGDLFRVLKLEKPVSSMSCHVDEDVGAGVRQESLGPRSVVRDSARQQPDKVLHRHLKKDEPLTQGQNDSKGCFSHTSYPL